MPGYTNPQNLNRYSYVSNNPLRYNDPTGHQLCGDGEYVNCGGTLTTPTGNAGNCSGSACQGGGGNNGDIDEDDVDEQTSQTPSCNMYPCPPLYGPNIECNIYPCPGSGTSYSPYDIFTGFWEMNHFSGGGIRIGFSIWSPIPLIGGDISLDVIQNSNSGETTLYFTPSLLIGVGEGGDASFSAVGLYDAPSAADVKGASFGTQANLTILGGVQGSYNYSDTTGSSGLHAQTWAIGPSAGAEGSISGSFGWTFMVVNRKP